MQRFDAVNPDRARDLEGLVRAMPIVAFLGLRVVELAPGDVRVEMPYRDELAFVPGTSYAMLGSPLRA